MRLLKGTGRGSVEPNDIGLIFCTTIRGTAEKYAAWGDSGEVVEFDANVEGVANLNDQATAEKIIDYISEYDSHYKNNRDALVEELTHNGESEIAIMDDDTIRQAIADLGYTGATQDGHYALFSD